MKDFIKRHFLISLLTVFCLGGLTVWAADKVWKNYSTPKNQPMTETSDLLVSPKFDDLFGSDFFKQSRDPFREMERLHREMTKNFGPFGFNEDHFDNWFQQSFGGSPADFQVKEDKDFVYYEIHPGEELPTELKVEVQDGQITIRGTIERKSEEGSSARHFSSSFVRSFPAPENVQAEDFQMEQQGQKIVIKFPKLTTI